MEFEWDPEKRRTNLLRHGVDFEAAKKIFDFFVFQKLDDREDYGEERWIAIGLADGRELYVVYSDVRRDNATVRRIISARRAATHERKIYYEEFGRRN